MEVTLSILVCRVCRVVLFGDVYWFWVEGCVCVPFCGAAVVIGSGCELILAGGACVLVFSSVRIKSRALWGSQSYFRAAWVNVESGIESPSTALIWSKQEYNRPVQTQTNRTIKTTDKKHSQQNMLTFLNTTVYVHTKPSRNVQNYTKIRCCPFKLFIHQNPP